MATEKVLNQLVKAESDLAAQATALEQELAELHEKIKGLQTVINMFGGSADSNGAQASTLAQAVAAVAAVESETTPEQVVAVAAPEEVAESPVAATAAKRAGARGRKKTARKVPAKAKKVATKVKAAPAKAAKKAPASVKATKRSGRTANWQRYVRDDFSDTPLPNVVENILKAQPKAVFKIVNVMSEIFPGDMPKAQFLKARNRISNILSAGAREGEWYRGRGGTYSCSQKALTAS